jgi:SAM-dependent methyltransferase
MDDGTGGWVIRNIRWDKTSVYRNGTVEGTMNAERTAKSVWDTVVSDPVKLDDLWTSSAIFIDEPDGGDEEVGEGYFNRKGLRESSALGHMRDFHNLVVKNFLIRSGARGNLRGTKIVDIACGKGGDIPRFQQSGASFVLGLDVVPDNILNLDDGAIRRYINIPLRNRKVDMMFALVDCGKDIFAEKSAIDDESRKIISDVFADGTKLGTRADKVTCMFALHYFFKDLTTVDTFFHNIARILRSPSKGEIIPPCFVVSYFDAGKVHRLLKDKTTPDNRTYRSMVGTDVAWSIQALYDVDAVEDSIASGKADGPEGLGLEIKVYIRSINKWHNEYLVGRKTLKEVGLRHGLYVFEKAPKESPTDLQLAIETAGKKAGYIPGATFDTLFNIIKASDNVGKAREMTDYEKELSFLYRWDVMLKIDKSFSG